MTELFKQDIAALVLSASTSVAQSGLRIVLVLVGGYVAVRFLRVAMRRLEDVLKEAGAAPGDMTPKLFRALDLAYPAEPVELPADASPLDVLRAELAE